MLSAPAPTTVSPVAVHRWRALVAVYAILLTALVGLGGTVFALVITAETLPIASAADPAVLPEAEGRALFDVLNAHLHLLLPAIVGGMAAVALGVLLVLVAAGISRALPRWFVAAGLVYLGLFVALPPDPPRPVAMVMYLVEVAFLAGLGWFGLRAARAE